MQPLSYQLAETTCWIACMLNGIRYLLKHNRLVTPVYRAVHSLLQDRGVVYYEEGDLEALNEVYWRLERYTNLTFKYSRGCDVEPTLRRLKLSGDQVAICDVGDGDHSILLVERNDGWLKAFDPYWYAQRIENENVLVVGEWCANINICENHLLGDDLPAHQEAYGLGQAYPMGQAPETRFMTVICRQG